MTQSKWYFIFVIIINNVFYSQSFDQIDKYSNYIGKPFNILEKELNIIPTGKKIRFGLEYRSYSIKKFDALISEVDDSKTIGEIAIITDKGNLNEETWYNIVSRMFRNNEYIYIKSSLADPDDLFTSDNYTYEQLISILRNNYKTNKFIYDISFKKNNSCLNISYVSGIYIDIKINKCEDLKYSSIQKSNTIIDDNDSSIFSEVDFTPEYPGGINSFRNKINEEFKITNISNRSSNVGRAEISFTVEKDGSISDIIAYGPNMDFNNEAIRTVKTIVGRWTPAKIQNVKVRYRMRIPLTINME